MPEHGKSLEFGGIQFFDSARHKAAPANQAVADVLIQYLGHLRFYARGADCWGEVCQRRGMFDKAKRAKVGMIKEEHKLILVPALADDLTAIPISWGVRMRSGEMRLRSAFVHYGISMRRESSWMLKASIAEFPGVGPAMVVDLAPGMHEGQVSQGASLLR